MASLDIGLHPLKDEAPKEAILKGQQGKRDDLEWFEGHDAVNGAEKR